MGDINASIRRKKPSSNDHHFKIFCDEEKLHVFPLSPNVDTYHHFSGSCSSQIDLTICLKKQQDTVHKVNVEIRDPLNTSPHDAIIAHTTLELKQSHTPSIQRKITLQRRTNWNKIDIEKYATLTDDKLSALHQTIMPDLHTDIVVSRVNNILTECSNQCLPPKVKSRKVSKFKWNKELKPAIAKSKRAFYEWKKANQIRTESNPKFIAMKLARSHLRQTQRQLAARERHKTYREIMEADTNDKHLFYKLIKRQKETPYSTQTNAINFSENINGEMVEEKWAHYYENLATPKNLPEYDNDYKDSVHLQRLLLSVIPSHEPPPVIEEEQVAKHVKSLANNKAADIFGITSEHIKFASPTIIPILTDIVNRVLTNGKLPDDTKIGIATPIPKKAKTQTDPDKFRRITITSLVGKVVEKHMAQLSKQPLYLHQSPLQFGFTEGVPCNIAAMLLTESILHCIDSHVPIYITYMDATKAFDVVDHDSALVHLYKQGITGSLWSCYNSLYTNIMSHIKWNGQVSAAFKEEQGIRQGGITSTGMFKAKANPCLTKLQNHPSSLHIGHLKVGALMVADDLVLTGTSSEDVQELVAEAQLDAERERFSFSKTKTRSMVVSKGAKNTHPEPSAKLQGTVIEKSSNETHLGITRTEDGTNGVTVSNRIKTARRTSYELMGAGLHGINGVGPEVSKHLWAIYIMPRFSNGLEALLLTHKETTRLENFYRSNLRSIQAMSKATATAIIYLLIGTPPFEAQLHIKTITFFTSALRREDSLEYAVIQRQLVMKGEETRSWVWYVHSLLKKYGLPSAFDLLHYHPSKDEWKRTVKKAVLSTWEKQLKDEARSKSTLKYINIDACNLHTPHPVWQIGAADILTVIRATTKVKLMTQRYPLYYSRTAGMHYGKNCPLCGSTLETLAHFLLDCSVLADIRSPYLVRLQAAINKEALHQPDTDDELVTMILDPSNFCKDKTYEIEQITRDMCHALHTKRSTHLGYTPRHISVSGPSIL